MASLLALLSGGALAQAGSAPEAAQAPVAPSIEPDIYDVRIVARYPHDPQAFTQGLLWHDGALYESTGWVSRSEIRKLDLASGEVLARQPIPLQQFGEGMTLWDDQLISLTWRDGVVHRWRLDTLEPVRATADYPSEGWGLTTLDDALIASDGSSTLRVLDPQDYTLRRTIEVTVRGKPLGQLNELEAIDGLIYANVWMTGFIVAIDPADGTVKRIIDARNLPGPETADRNAVLNGIAWDSANGRLFVTGKLWPWLYQIELDKREPAM